MGRLKTGLARSVKREFRKQSRREDRAELRLLNDVWRCVAAHSTESHRLLLHVCDDVTVLECVPCGIPPVMGSDDLMQALMKELKESGIEFEVLCETEMVQ